MRSAIVLFLLQFLFQLNGKGQELEWQPTSREVVVSSKDSVIRARIKIQKNPVKINDTYTYYWHDKGELRCNIGGYTGELLHGDYIVLDSDHNLITKGKFDNGLKVGTWKKWNSKGNLVRTETYTNGNLHGRQNIFNGEGQISKTREFKNGKLEVKNDKFAGMLRKKKSNAADSTNTNKVEQEPNKDDKE